jgi:uncharacterized integral membrane protein
VQEQPVERQRGPISASLIVGVIIFAVALIFALSNLGKVSLNFMWMHFEFPAFVLFLLMLLAGVAIDRILQWWWPRHKAKTRARAD